MLAVKSYLSKWSHYCYIQLMIEEIKKSIRTIPDFPKKGILFRDITTAIRDPKSFDLIIEAFKQELDGVEFDGIAGIESRGFVFASVLSFIFKKKLILIRKKGKLPCKVIRQEYQLEYGSDELEIDPTSIEKSERIILVDDLLATAGTIIAAKTLVEKCDGVVAKSLFVIDLPDLKGAEKLRSHQMDFSSIVNFDGE